MSDLYLQAMMHGEFANKKASLKKPEKDRISEAVEEEIDRYLDTLNLDDKNDTESHLLSPELKRVKMKAELLEAIEHSELNHQIGWAFSILKMEGLHYLTKEKYEALEQNLAAAAETLKTIDPHTQTTQNFQEVLGINDHTLEDCIFIANEKFNTNHFADALALSILIVSLAAENARYWYRAAIAAQNALRYDLAIKIYITAIDIDPTLYEAWFFIAICYLSQGLYSQAAEAFEKAKEIAQGIKLEDSWQKLFVHTEEVLKAPHK
jgi:tetratricopeptide (TPR) repeat protein